MGEKNVLSSLAAELAEVLLQQGRDKEAVRLTEISQAATGREDTWSQILWRSARAKASTRQGNLDEAERHAREAVRLATGIDYLDLRAGALLALAEVLRLAGHLQPARALLLETAGLYRQKGNLALLASVETLLAH
jgi:tetratricopeptide (TPR) repeat protein